MDVTLESKGMRVHVNSVDTQPSDALSAVVRVRLPLSKSFSIKYDFENSVRTEIESIRRRYAEHGAGARELAGVTKSGVGLVPDQAAFMSKVRLLLGWQELLELTDALDSEGSEASGLIEGRDKLRENVTNNYRRGVADLRQQLLNQRKGASLVGGLLRSGSDLLANFGLQLVREPSLRLSLQDDLLRLAEDESVSPDIREVARGYLRYWARFRQSERSDDR